MPSVCPAARGPLTRLLCFQYSLCNEPLIELSNPGASGSLFYVTSDDEFIIKTVMHKEAEFLQKLLPGYYMVRGPPCGVDGSSVSPLLPADRSRCLRGLGRRPWGASRGIWGPRDSPSGVPRQASPAPVTSVQELPSLPPVATRPEGRPRAGLGGHRLLPGSPSPPGQHPYEPWAPEAAARGQCLSCHGGPSSPRVPRRDPERRGRATGWHPTKDQLLGQA